MNRLTGQFTAQGPEDELVLADPVEASKGGGHHRNLEMVTAAGEVFHLHGRIREGTADGGK